MTKLLPVLLILSLSAGAQGKKQKFEYYLIGSSITFSYGSSSAMMSNMPIECIYLPTEKYLEDFIRNNMNKQGFDTTRMSVVIIAFSKFKSKKQYDYYLSEQNKHTSKP